MFAPLDRLGDRREDHLGDIFGIGRLHPLMLGESEDDRPVDFDEFLPCRLVRRVADADKQALSRFRGPNSSRGASL